MDQIAGHVTNYWNLRRVIDADAGIDPVWGEIAYYKVGGRIEAVRERWLRFIPAYASGVLRGVVEARRWMRREPTAVTFANISVAPMFPRRFRSTQLVLDFDSTPLQIDRMPAYESPNDPRLVAAIKFRTTRRLFRTAAVLHAWSNWAKESVVTDYGISPDRIVVNPPGVDLTFWSLSNVARPPATAVKILFVGGDFERKGGNLLLEWFTRRPADEVELHLVTRHAGDDAPGVVWHTGLEPNTPELLQLYHQADVFVLPSLGECFGIATVEAMATGLPVVTSDVGGVADIVDDGRNGFIVPANDVPALGDALERLIADSAMRLRFGVHSRHIAEERFDLVTNARRTAALIRDLIAQGSGGASPTTMAGHD